MKPNKTAILLIGVFGTTAIAWWRASHHQRVGTAAPSQPVVAYDADPGWAVPPGMSRWDCIVIHHSATEVEGAARFNAAHRAKGWDELGYHFVIGNGTDTPDGQVEIGPRWSEQKHGAHCYTPDEYYNNHGIGICLVGNLDLHPPTEKQLRSLERLVRFLCHRYGLPASRIYTHGGVTGKTRCPGKDFNLKKLRAAVATGP